MNPTPGAITTESLTLSVPTVSVFSTMSVGMTAQHSIPKDGIIEITLPKWNSFAQFESQKKSLIAVSTNPGTVSCSPVTGITSLNSLLYCELAQGTSEDTFRVYFTDLLTADIAADTYLTFTVKGVRGPPSVSAMTGFSFRTLTASG